jgi:hypothetical protein
MLGTYNAFGIFLPGNQIPDWFTHKGEGPSICFEVRIVDQMLKGFGVCVVYSSRVLVLGSYRGRMSIINHTKNNILAYQSPESSGGPFPQGDHLLLRNVVITNNNFEDADEVEIFIDWGPEIIVNKIGVCLLYDGVGVADEKASKGISKKRKRGSPNNTNDSKLLQTAEENEYCLFYSFMRRYQKFHFE